MVIVVTGENLHRVRAEITSVTDAFIAAHDALAVERFDAAEAEAEHILSAVSGVSLLSPAKLVIVQNFEVNKPLTEQTESLLEQVADDTTLLIVIGKLDKRLAYGKLLKKAADWREFNQLSPQDTVRWIAQASAEKGGRIDNRTAQYLLDCVGADQERLSNELDKLILFDAQITTETIDLLCERQPTSTVFELLDAGFHGQQQKALRLYDEQRRQQVEPLAMVGMIGWQLHILALTKTAKGKSATDIARDAGVHPFVVQKTQNLARDMSLGKIKQLVHQAVVLEEQFKTRAINADDAVKHFLLSL